MMDSKIILRLRALTVRNSGKEYDLNTTPMGRKRGIL